MKRVLLGDQGLEVGAQGLGCMNLSGMYTGAVSQQDAERTIARAVELGVTLFDTADVYGPYTNELLVGRVLKQVSDAVIATKCGLVDVRNPVLADRINGSPEHIRASCDASLQRLDVDAIDLYYLHRADPRVPIEDSVGAMSELVDAGKVRYLGLSEVSGETLRRAHAVHPISALESEWSMFARDFEQGALATARELSVGIVPYAPLAKGFLAGAWSQLSDMPAEDMRRNWPWFAPGNFEANQRLAAELVSFAAKRGLTASVVALAWVHARGDDVVPIPGSDNIRDLESNVTASELNLSPDDLAALDEMVPVGEVQGTRYPDMAWVNGVTPPKQH